MQNKININIAVDVVKSLSNKSLECAVYMMDDSFLGSVNQGTQNLCTLCQPGQMIHWTVYAIDLQTPVAIKNITFISAHVQYPDRVSGNLTDDNPNSKIWTGILPLMKWGQEYRYSLKLQMGNGKNSFISINTPSLKWGGSCLSK